MKVEIDEAAESIMHIKICESVKLSWKQMQRYADDYTEWDR